MIRKIDISLWDIIVTFGSGILFLILIVIHLLFLRVLTPSEILIMMDIPSSFLVILGLPLIFVAGLLLDAISITLGDFFVEPVFKMTEDSKEIEKLTEIIKEKYIKPEEPEVSENIEKPFHWAKDYLIQNQIETNYMVFLSKFGFYRNVAFILFLNALIFLIYFFISGFELKFMATFVVSLFAGVLFSLRSKKFYGYVGMTVLRNYLIAKSRDGSRE